MAVLALAVVALLATVILVGSVRLPKPPLLSDGVVPYAVVLEDERLEIRLVALDGTVTTIGYPDDSVDCPVFAPDGTKLAFAVEAPTDPTAAAVNGLAVVTLAAPSERTQLDPAMKAWDTSSPIAWAPGSDAIVSLAGPTWDDPSLRTLRWFPLDGGPSTPLVDARLSAINPAWSPSGEWIAFVGLHDGDKRIDLVRPNGTGLRGVAAFSRQLRSEAIAWSPDSQWIAYGGDPVDAATASVTDPLDIWIVRSDGSERRNLTRTDDRAERGPAWSPDGRAVAYYVGGGVEGLDVATGRRWQLPTTNVRSFGWSATGDSLVVLREAVIGSPTGSEVWIIPSDGSSGGRRLVSGATPSCFPTGGTLSWQRR